MSFKRGSRGCWSKFKVLQELVLWKWNNYQVYECIQIFGSQQRHRKTAMRNPDLALRQYNVRCALYGIASNPDLFCGSAKESKVVEIVSKQFKDNFLLFSYMPLNVVPAIDTLQNLFKFLIDYEHHWSMPDSWVESQYQQCQAINNIIFLQRVHNLHVLEVARKNVNFKENYLTLSETRLYFQ